MAEKKNLIRELIETGKRNMTFEQCRRIALALETSMDYLAGLTDEQRPYPPKK